MKHAETNPLFDWIFWGIILGLPVVVLAPCLCFRCYRRRPIRWLKKLCGVRLFYRNELLQRRYDGVLPKIMTTVSILMFLAGGGVMGVGIYALVKGILTSAAMPVVTVGFGIVLSAVFGLFGLCTRTRGVSCFTVAYFMACMTATCILIFRFFLMPSSCRGSLDVWVDRYWDVFSDLFSFAIDPTASRAEQVNQVVESLQEKIFIVVAVLVIIFLVLIVAMVVSGLLITGKILRATIFTFLHWWLFFSGLGIVVLTAYSSSVASDAGELENGVPSWHCGWNCVPCSQLHGAKNSVSQAASSDAVVLHSQRSFHCILFCGRVLHARGTYHHHRNA